MKALHEAEHAAEWECRERIRLNDGTYKKLPPCVKKLLDEHYLDIPPLHFPHVAPDGVSIEFTKSPEAGMLGRLTAMRPGRYFQKHFPALSSSEIQELSSSFHAELNEEKTTLKFATDKDTINRIFETTMYPGRDGDCFSCMCASAHTPKKWWSNAENRPYHVYANSPDVMIAYLETTDGKHIVARAVINTVENRYNRIYASRHGELPEDGFREQSNRWTELRERLRNLGYGSGSLAGCRLTPTYSNDITLLPYIDGEANQVGIDDEGQWVVQRDEEDEFCLEVLSATGIHGFPDGEGEACNNCGEVTADATYIDYCDDYVCRDCLDAHFILAYVDITGSMEGYVPVDEVIEDCQGEHYSGEFSLDFSEDDGDYHGTRGCPHDEYECDECGKIGWDEDDFNGLYCNDCFNEQNADVEECSPVNHL